MVRKVAWIMVTTLFALVVFSLLFRSPGADQRSTHPYNAQQIRLLAALEQDSFVLSATFSPDGKTLASGGAEGTVRLWGVPAASG